MAIFPLASSLDTASGINGQQQQDTREELRIYACQGKQQLSRYRAVRLPSPENDSTTLSYYVIEGDSNTFLLLGKAGSEIRSFGDSPFSLHETNERPLAAIAKDCF